MLPCPSIAATEAARAATVEKYKYSRKIEMKKKIVTMITNATKEYTTIEENVRRDNKTKRILKTIDQRRLTKKKRVPNQWPDHPT